MGALTLKSFPFELRGWDIEKFESIDPTDGFASDTRVYISNDQIVQIEPDYNLHTFNTWLTDKGRQFFDGIFTIRASKENKIKLTTQKEYSWLEVLKTVIQAIYFFDHCNKQNKTNYFFTIVFENVSLEILSMLLIISHKYSFINLKRAENIKKNNDLESSFQLNLATNKLKLNSSTLCLLVSNNPRYEGYSLNLNIRQRMLKGNFKCFTIGSLVNLTFPISFLGSNLNILKTLTEGNNLTCQDLKFSKNPFIVFNNELFKRNDGKNSIEMLKILNHSNIFNTTWNGLNVLNPSLYETGIQNLAQFSPLTPKDIVNFSSVFFLNVTINNIVNLKKITESKLLNFSLTSNKQLNINKPFLDQNSHINNNLTFYNQKYTFENQTFQKYLYLPTSMFFENNETFINTEGLIKKTTKLLSKNKTKNSWQILRKFLTSFKKDLTSLKRQDNNLVFFNATKTANFRNFTSFQFCATQSLNNLNYYLNTKTQPFLLYQINSNYKQKSIKVFSTKLKYWLDDFFSGGKDEYSQNSLILINCSKMLRTGSTNFF
jgi:NADH dehydrogenase/NADH:ubiquinone oxidoreductase subunit G